MTEKDIMVGDWFRFRYTTISNREIVHTFRISQIENQLGQYYVWGDGFGRMCHPENLEPIPLTPEILEKNGFYWGNTASEEDFCGAVGCGYPESGWCFDEGAGEIKIIFPNETDGGLIRLDDQSGDRHLELVFCNPIMVHDLQHALRLCGISKDITL